MPSHNSEAPHIPKGELWVQVRLYPRIDFALVPYPTLVTQPHGLSPCPAQHIKSACLGNFALAVGTLLSEILWAFSSQPPPTGVLTEALG